MSQITGNLSFNMATQRLQHVRAGRLADRADGEGALRRALRPLQVPGRASPTRRSRRRTQFNIDKNNFGPRAGVAWSIDAEDACCAPASGIMYDQPILGGYEQALQSQRIAARAGLHVQRHVGRRAGVPERRPRPARWRMQSPWAVDPELRGRAHLADQRAARARVRPRLHGVGRRHVRQRQPACRSSPTST